MAASCSGGLKLCAEDGNESLLADGRQHAFQLTYRVKSSTMTAVRKLGTLS